MKRGKVIVLEGLDYSGKGVLISGIKELTTTGNPRRKAYAHENHSVVFTREPGGTPFAESIRTLLVVEEDAQALGDKNKKLGTVTQFLAFWAARSDHWERFVIPAVRNGGIVFCDRADASTFAYQLPLPAEVEKDSTLVSMSWVLRKLVYGECAPDLYLFIDVSPEECKRRMKEAVDKGERSLSDFDASPIGFHRAVRDRYRAFGSMVPNFIRIDGEQSPENVLRDVMKEVDRILIP